MKKYFTPHKQSLELRELGFGEQCLTYYRNGKLMFHTIQTHERENVKGHDFNDDWIDVDCSAPLWDQVFNWFRTKHKLDGYIFSNGSERYTLVVKDLFSRTTLIEAPFNYSVVLK